VAGDGDRALAIIAELEDISTTQYVAAASIASIHAGLQQADAAFECLERAYRDHSVEMIYLKVDPRFDGLRADSRFLDLLRRVGLE